MFACKNERVLRIKKIKPLILALLVLFSQTHKLRLELVIDALRKTKNKNKTEGSLFFFVVFLLFHHLISKLLSQKQKNQLKTKTLKVPQSQREVHYIRALVFDFDLNYICIYTATYRRYMHPKYCPYPSVIFVCFWQVRGCQNTNHITAEQGQGQLVRTIYIRILYSVRSMSNQHLDFGQ